MIFIVLLLNEPLQTEEQNDWLVATSLLECLSSDLFVVVERSFNLGKKDLLCPVIGV